MSFINHQTPYDATSAPCAPCVSDSTYHTIFVYPSIYTYIQQHQKKHMTPLLCTDIIVPPCFPVPFYAYPSVYGTSSWCIYP